MTHTTEPPSPTIDEEDLKTLLTQYEKYSEGLQSANTKTQEELDKSLITLSTVIIGVILTLRQQISTVMPGFGFPPLMWVTIVLLVLCVFSVLISHFLSLHMNQQLIKAIEECRDAQRPIDLLPRVEAVHRKTALVAVNNYMSAGLFFCGLVAAVAFAISGAGTMG